MLQAFEDNGPYYRNLLDAMPMPIMLVDDDLTLVDLNPAASEMMQKTKSETLRKRGGEAMSCVHMIDSPAGCGAGPHCRDCDVRNSVRDANSGKAVQRRRSQFEVLHDGHVGRRDILITASPVDVLGRQLVLLIFEDITEMTKLRSLIPMCSHCRRVRIDEEYWQSVEQYLETQHATSFTHGLCQECLQTFYPTVSERILAKRNGESNKP
ncbi:MAG: PAS domain-containing protein [Ignavibacteriae bacterium]|nr:PAS domain-containing protein [Ignavibacteriota bacterium]